MARFLILFVLAASSAQAGDVAKGRAVFVQQCSICHSVAAHAPPGVGPSLFGVVGRKPGSVPGYAYSAAMRAAGQAWTLDRLDVYIESPQKTIPGIKMPYPGLKDAPKRQDLLSYLNSVK